MSRAADYPSEWPAVSLATKIEAGFRCVRCGHPNGEWSPAGADHEGLARAMRERFGLSTLPRIYEVDNGAWVRCYLLPCDGRCTHDPAVRDHRVLTVHHLDGVKDNLAWWNLAALCQRCHLEIQGRVKMEQAYLHPHSEWFLPYVAGYYAAAVGGLTLTRTEVVDRLAELLALGQPHLADHYAGAVA